MVEQSPPLAGQESFFFYGTLLVPEILVRVLGHNCDSLTFQSALLVDHSRHHIKNEDYPAVIPKEQTLELCANYELPPPDDISVRGTLVKGLTAQDVVYLDTFEDNEYTRKRLAIQPLSPPYHLSDYPSVLPGTSATAAAIQEEQGNLEKHEAWVYIWTDKLSKLEPSVWSYEQFMTDKAHAWVGRDKDEFYTEVDGERQMRAARDIVNGDRPLVAEPNEIEQPIPDADESFIEGKTADGYEEFGHNMLKFWKFEEGFLNFNHGAWGSPPRPVIDAMRAATDKIESNVNLFMKREYLKPLNEVRHTVATMIGASEDEVVMVPNSSHGVNNVVQQIRWEAGDVILIYSTTYGSVAQTTKYLCDRYDIEMEVVEVTFPCSHEEIVRKTEERIERYNSPAVPSYTGEAKPTGKSADKRIRLAIIDGIISNPGVVFPWRDLARLCKKYGILSMVDGAHCIGQIKVDIKDGDPDFFVSNCHKWLYSHRGNAFLYVPQRNQRLISVSFPASYTYESTKYPSATGKRGTFTEQYEWPGTIDYTPILGIRDAVKFRKDIGGEERIMKYCHTLAVQGGRLLAKKWGTTIMENQDLSKGELTAAMVNVQLPVTLGDGWTGIAKQWKFFEDNMFEKKVFCAVFQHGGKFWARFSAQVWIELSDFDRIGDILQDISKAYNRNEAEQIDVSDRQAGPTPAEVPVLDG